MLFVALVLLVGGVTGQSCLYRGTSGTCQLISSCPYSYEPSMVPVNTTGCQSITVRKKKKKKAKFANNTFFSSSFFFFFFFSGSECSMLCTCRLFRKWPHGLLPRPLAVRRHASANERGCNRMSKTARRNPMLPALRADPVADAKAADSVSDAATNAAANAAADSISDAADSISDTAAARYDSDANAAACACHAGSGRRSCAVHVDGAHLSECQR